MTVKKILAQRQKTHGSFESHAAISQGLKAVMQASPNWNELTDVQREALEMMQHKVARLLNGDYTFLDHVVDIGGYNELMFNHMSGFGNGKKR